MYTSAVHRLARAVAQGGRARLRVRIAALAALLVIPSAIGVRTVGRVGPGRGPMQPAAVVTTGGEVAIAAEVHPVTASQGEPVRITVIVRGMASRLGAVRLEVYDPVGGMVFQRFWEGRSLGARQELRRQVAWRIPSNARTGDWTLKVSVFDRGWNGPVALNDAANPILSQGSGDMRAWRDTAARLTVRSGPVPNDTAPPTTAPATTHPNGLAIPVRFNTLPPGATLPSGSRCAAWVRARPLPERKRMNRSFNQAIGHRLAPGFFDPGATHPGANRLAARVDGAFTGTTEQILRWAACKWGVDEDLVRAQAAVESWWRQTTRGDWAGDPSACPPGHALGVDGRPGQCPQSYGILQNRYPYERSAWPGIHRSTAMNVDTAYAVWRSCFEGYERWLSDVERGRPYSRGDAWGCAGRWFSGRWHTQPAEDYITKVKRYLHGRVWEQPDFQEP
jgi:autotransporter family porin